jgi:hypothetical protein
MALILRENYRRRFMYGKSDKRYFRNALKVNRMMRNGPIEKQF